MLQANNETGHISLITLDHAWPKQGRFLFTMGCSILGLLMNAFFVAAFFIDDYFKRIGLVFQILVCLSDIIISIGVIPVSAYVILSEVGDNPDVCVALQFLIEASTYSYSVFFAMMSLETYIHLRRAGWDNDLYILKRIAIIAIVIIIINFITAGVGIIQGLDFDSCKRSHTGNFIYRTISNLTFHIIPCIITVVCSVLACIEMKNRAKAYIHYRESQKYKNDRYGHFANIIAFVLYIGAWTPFVILVNLYPASNDTKFYYAVWLGVGRSIINSFVYGVLDVNFRRAYNHSLDCGN